MDVLMVLKENQGLKVTWNIKQDGGQFGCFT